MKNWLLRGESVGYGTVWVLKLLRWCLMPFLGPFLDGALADGCTEMLVLWCLGMLFLPLEGAEPLVHMTIALLFAYVVWWLVFGIQSLWNPRQKKKAARDEAQKGGA